MKALLGAHAAGGFATPAVVQTTEQATASTTVTATWPGTPTNGNLMIVAIPSGGNATVTTPSGWTAGPTELGATPDIATFYKVASGESTSLPSFASTSTARLMAWEVSGLSGSVDVSQGTVPGSNGTSMDFTPTATTAAAGFAIAVISLGNSSGGFSNAWDGGFAQRFVLGGSGGSTTGADCIYSAAAALDTTETWISSRSRSGLIVAFTATPL